MGIEVAVLIISFVFLLAIGVPIAFSLLVSAGLTLAASISGDIAMATLAQRMATGLDSFALLAIPFFILAGELMNRGGIATRLIDFAKALVGSLPGGLAYVNIVGCMVFGAVSGSAVAAGSAIGSLVTATIFPSEIPTFATASNSVSGSMTRPLLMTRPYS